MMKQFICLLAFHVVGVYSVSAETVKEVLSAKKVCEKQDGYIQATPGNEAEMADFVEKVNEKRKGIYASIASRDGTSPEIVARLQANTQNPEDLCKG